MLLNVQWTAFPYRVNVCTAQWCFVMEVNHATASTCASGICQQGFHNWPCPLPQAPQGQGKTEPEILVIHSHAKYTDCEILGQQNCCCCTSNCACKWACEILNLHLLGDTQMNVGPA